VADVEGHNLIHQIYWFGLPDATERRVDADRWSRQRFPGRLGEPVLQAAPKAEEEGLGHRRTKYVRSAPAALRLCNN
jgi:hypothetical protein